MTRIDFTDVSKRFAATQALDGFSLTVASGELVSLLGPSGCGKTTALRILAGFERADSGDVTIDGSPILATPAQHRGFGMVFQSYSLFPNMTAAANIGFPLRIRRRSRGEMADRVTELLTLTGLGDHAEKYPHQLSGGQQQRVALARALATEPRVLLLDEPLSALDAAVREQLRDEIRRLQQELGITTVFVTHDQQEALTISDRVAVMRAGSIVQLGAPADVYLNPASLFVSTFLGTSNRVVATVGDHGAGLVLGRPVPGVTGGDAVLVRPEHLGVLPGDSGEPSTPARLVSVAFTGALTRLICVVDDGGHPDPDTGAGDPAVDDGRVLVVDVASAEAAGVGSGDRVRVTLTGPVTPVGGLAS